LFDFESFPETIRAVQEHGGITSSGELNGFGAITYAGHEIEAALDGAELIFAVGPAYSTRPFAEACRPHLQKGQVVVVCPGSCGGSIEFKNTAGLDLGDDQVVVAETATLPYAVRLMAPGRIHVYLKLKDAIYLAALPARLTATVVETLESVHSGICAAENVLQTSLQNGNPVIHPAVTLLNAALIERTEGDFLFYEDGVTPAVGRLIRAVDEERIAIGRRLAVEVISEPELGLRQGFMADATYDRGYSEAPGFKGIPAQHQLDYRYFNEDVGYGLVFLESLGAQVGEETPIISALIDLVGVVMQRDYRGEALRTMDSLGLAKYSVAELSQLVG
jgi:opine dehydrogenase